MNMLQDFAYVIEQLKEEQVVIELSSSNEIPFFRFVFLYADGRKETVLMYFPREDVFVAAGADDYTTEKLREKIKGMIH